MRFDLPLRHYISCVRVFTLELDVFGVSLTVRFYGDGAYAVLWCDHMGCLARESVSGGGVGECVRAAVDVGELNGWRLVGKAYCDRHHPRGDPRAPTTVADGFSWLTVALGGSQGRGAA